MKKGKITALLLSAALVFGSMPAGVAYGAPETEISSIALENDAAAEIDETEDVETEEATMAEEIVISGAAEEVLEDAAEEIAAAEGEEEDKIASDASEASGAAELEMIASNGLFMPDFEPVSVEYAEANQFDAAEAELAVGSAKYLTDYDKYSSYYIYNQLNSEEKEYWDKLDLLCQYVMDSNDDLDYTYNNGYQYGVLKAVPAPKTFSVQPLRGESGNRGKIRALNFLYIYSHPQYYFLDGYGATSDGSYGILYTYAEFIGGDIRKKATTDFWDGVDSLKKEVDRIVKESGVTGTEDYVRLKAIHDAITAGIKYNYPMGKMISAGTMYYDWEFTQSAYSAVVGNYTVCAGFSKITELLCDYYDIECAAVTSTGHAWNHVIVDDDMYLVDNTWDENVTEAYGVMYYIHFLKAYNFDSKHTPETIYTGLNFESTRTTKTVDDGKTAVAPEVAAEKCATPTVSTLGSKVTFSCATPGAKLYYTTDGEKPSRAITKSTLYNGNIDTYGNFKIIAVKEGFLDSDVAEKRVGYNISYVLNGGINDVNNPTGYLGTETSPILLNDASLSGYSFAGWYTDENLSNAIVEIDPSLKKDITLYAKWSMEAPKPEDSRGAYSIQSVVQTPGFRNFLSKVGTDGSTTFNYGKWNCYGYTYENGIFNSYSYNMFLAYTDGYTYKGKAIKPYVYVYNMTNGVEMEPGKHYSVGYKNNKNASTDGSPAYIVIRGKGSKYKGVKMDKDRFTKEGNPFTISPVSLNDDNVTLVEVATPYKNGKPQTKKKPLVYLNGVKLGAKDYVLEYPGNNAVTPTDGEEDPVVGKIGSNPYGDVGKYIVTVKAGASGNIKDSRNTQMIVTEGALITKAKVKYAKKYDYTGSPIKPEVSVTIKKVPLIEGKDYVVNYAGNTDIGKGLIVIKGIGEYSGTTVKNFTIK